MREDYRFAAVMNELIPLLRSLHHREEAELVLYALNRGSDNAEGISIPHVVLQEFAGLPTQADGLAVPNYIRTLLETVQFENGEVRFGETALETFARLWKEGLAGEMRPAEPQTVLEPACGSANDYRFLGSYGLADIINYAGFDLCPKNIENARVMFPQIRFQIGNVFEIPGADLAYDLCFVHDLLEHLSPEGLERAVQELCRVTRRALCVHFFSMDEIPAHIIRPVEDYHWNVLSMGLVKQLFADQGFDGQIVHVASFLRKELRAEQTHNPNSYSFILWRR
jgi:SAM-dependent methyltransferase